MLICSGATLSLKLSKQTTHLVCAQPAGQKYDKALEWGVSVVRDSWLLAMGQSGQLEPEDDHRHSKESSECITSNRVERWPTCAVPAPTGRTPLLGDNASSFRNVSGLIELSEPVDHRRTQVPSQNAPKPFPLPSSVSPSRALKPTPTHVDMEESGSIGNLGSGSHNPTHVYAPAQPLSPPKAETERRLNNAHSPRKRNAGSPPESIESKLSRLSSAPTQEAAARIRPNTGKAVTVMGIGGTEGRTEMTEVLRQLAQKDDSATRSKAVSGTFDFDLSSRMGC
jgi:DNA replication regulator DPB11